MAIVFRNNATTALASDITNSATSITVTDGSKFPSITGSDYFYCTFDDGTNNEIVKVTAISGNTLTVVRAQDNTTARAFSTGDIAELRLTAAVLETFSQLDEGEITADEFIGDLRGAVIFKAQAGEAVSKGDVVYVSGITGNTPVVSKADADDAAKMPAFGLILTTASLNASTEVVTFGTISGVNTSAFSLGDTLYVSTTAGTLTATKPTGESALIQNIGKVQRAHASAGSIKVGGAGRTNDVPNLNDGNIFIGNGSNQSSTASLNTKVEEYLDGGTSTPTFSTLNVSGNTTLTGDLTVNGTTTSLNTNTLDVEDKNITLNYSTGDSSASADGSGITIQDAVNSTTDATILWDATNDRFDFSHGVTFPDNKKAIFGTGSDLEIYHDGTHSYIADVGSGVLFIRGENNIVLESNSGSNYFEGTSGGASRIYFAGDQKLNTTSTGINVTGDITANAENAELQLVDTSSGNTTSILSNNFDTTISADGRIFFRAGGSNDNIIQISSGGDISFYDDTGSTQGLFWDASTERLGIGNTAPSNTLDVTGGISLSGNIVVPTGKGLKSSGEFLNLESSRYLRYKKTGDSHNMLSIDGTADTITFSTTGSSDVVIDNSGRLGIGTTSPSQALGVEGKIFLSGDAQHVYFGGNNTFIGERSNSTHLELRGGGNSAAQTVYIDNNGKLGLGTASPSGSIHTKSTGDNNFYLESGTSNLGQILFTDGSIAGRIKYNHSDDSMAFFANASEKARLNSTGLGIGTTAPSAALHVNGGIKLSDNNYLTWANSNTRMVGQSGYLQFQIAGSDSMRLTPTGLGIGTNSPSGLLEISADSDDGTSAPSFLITNASTTLNDGAVVGTIEFRNSDASGTPPHTAKIQGIANASDERTTELAFSTGSVGTTTERLRIASDGSVGIGTDSPSTKLQVFTDTGRDFKVDQSVANRTILSNSYRMVVKAGSGYDLDLDTGSANGNITFQNNGSEVARFDNNGRLGIGTTSPTNSITTTGALEFTGNAFNGSGTGVWSPATNELGFVTSGSTQVRINSSGNVGIGTSSPSAKLHVSGTTNLSDHITLSRGGGQFITKNDNSQYVLISGGNAGDSGQIILGGGTNGTYTGNILFRTGTTTTGEAARFDSSGTFIINNAGSGNGLIKINGATGSTEALIFQRGGTEASRIGHSNSAELTFSTGSGVSERMRIDSSGRVGIGTDNPVATLNVDSDAQNEIARFQGANAQLRIDNNTLNVINLNSGGSGDSLSISTNSSEAIRIDSSQNVGIGTTSPSAKLDVEGTAQVNLLDVTHTGDRAVNFTRTGANSFSIEHDLNQFYFWNQTTSESPLLFQNDGDVIMNAGNVGIGTTSPSSLLHLSSSSGHAITSTYTGQETFKFEHGTSGFYVKQDNVFQVGLDHNHDTVFYDDSGTEYVRLDGSTSRVGIGTSSIDAKLHVESANNYNGTNFESNPHLAIDNGTPTNHTAVLMFESSGTDASNKRSGITGGNYYSNKHGLGFFGDLASKDRSATPDMFVNSSGNVGIGTDSPAEAIHIQTANDTKLRITKTGTDSIYAGVNTSPFIQASSLRFMSDSSTEVGRFDSSGNLLVGQTSTAFPGAGNTTTGISVSGQYDAIFASRASGVPIVLNRNTDDGDIAQFRKDGSTVGSIGIQSSGLVIDGESAHTGLRFTSAGITPRLNGAESDNTVDLGESGIRFKDLYLSGQANVGTINNVAIKANETDFSDSILISTTGNTGTLSGTSNNTGLGNNVLRDLTTANNSTAIGESALANLTTGSNNTAIGSGTLSNVTTVGGNTAVGVAALANNTAAENTAIGKDAARVNTTGTRLVAIGFEALELNTTGDSNTAVGYEAMNRNTTGIRNVAVGQQALAYNTTANENTAVGVQALFLNTTGANNVAVGYDSLEANTTGTNNVSIGSWAMKENETGNANIAIGRYALENNISGANNVAIGYEALTSATDKYGQTAVGYQSLQKNTTGGANVGLGYRTLFDNTTGSYNVAIGTSALENSTTASNNTAVGYQAALNVTTGERITAIGYGAANAVTDVASVTAVGWNCLRNANSTATGVGAYCLSALTTGASNSAFGYYAMNATTTGQNNSAFGNQSLQFNTTGNSNTAVGHQALQDLTTASQNTALGYQAALNVTTGNNNVAIGYQTLISTTTNTNNVAIGYQALKDTTGGNNVAVGTSAATNLELSSGNTAIGTSALQTATAGVNTAIGFGSLKNNTTGTNNTALGYDALNDNTDGDANVAVGHDALELATASDNTAIGKSAGASITTGTNNTCIGKSSDPATATSTNSITLGDANITTLRCNTQTISALSDARDKSNVEDLQLGVEFIKDLRPVSFTWDRRDGSQNGVEDFGFIAQELDAVQEKHNEAERLGLVLKDNPDKLEASYGKLVPMLVKAIQELSEEVEELKQKLGE